MEEDDDGDAGEGIEEMSVKKSQLHFLKKRAILE